MTKANKLISNIVSELTTRLNGHATLFDLEIKNNAGITIGWAIADIDRECEYFERISINEAYVVGGYLQEEMKRLSERLAVEFEKEVTHWNDKQELNFLSNGRAYEIENYKISLRLNN